jgi:hypothetical protein
MAVSKLYNLIRFECATVGTGSIEVGSAVAGFLTPSDASIPDGARVSYAIAEGANSEVGWGIYDDDGETITRNVLASTNSGSPISLSGSAEVALTVLAEDLAPGLAPAESVGSSGTVDIGAEDALVVTITGTTTITSFGTGANLMRVVVFSGALTLTHNGTSLILPGGENIETEAGDTAVFVSDDSGNWRCISYQRADSIGGDDAFAMALLFG